MTAAARWLSEQLPPDLVMAGCAGDPHATHVPAAPGSLPGSHAAAARASLNGAGSRKPEAPSWDSLMILNCRRSPLAKISDFPG